MILEGTTVSESISWVLYTYLHFCLSSNTSIVVFQLPGSIIQKLLKCSLQVYKVTSHCDDFPPTLRALLPIHFPVHKNHAVFHKPSPVFPGFSSLIITLYAKWSSLSSRWDRHQHHHILSAPFLSPTSHIIKFPPPFRDSFHIFTKQNGDP